MFTTRLLGVILTGVGIVSQLPAPVGKALTTTTVAPATTTTLVDPAIVAKWEKVAWCETHGNWSMQGSIHSGGLGIKNVVWRSYGGAYYAPNAGLATKQEQILIATRINSSGFIPDQDGFCRGW